MNWHVGVVCQINIAKVKVKAKANANASAVMTFLVRTDSVMSQIESVFSNKNFFL
jgi:hypothetical protein